MASLGQQRGADLHLAIHQGCRAQDLLTVLDGDGAGRCGRRSRRYDCGESNRLTEWRRIQ